MEALNKKTFPQLPEAELLPLPDRGRETVSFIVMLVCGEYFVVEIDRVLEIIRVPQITWLPGAPPSIRGLINLRGAVLAVADLAVLLSHPGLEISPQNRIVIVEAAGVRLGLLVEEVAGAENAPSAALESSLRTLGEQRAVIVAQVDLNGKLSGVLDTGKLIEKARFTGTEIATALDQDHKFGGKNGN